MESFNGLPELPRARCRRDIRVLWIKYKDQDQAITEFKQSSFFLGLTPAFAILILRLAVALLQYWYSTNQHHPSLAYSHDEPGYSQGVE